MLKIIIFFVFSLIIVKISWTDIFGTNGRKFYRFFAIEFLFLLILVNYSYWLRNPFTIFRMITLVILGGSFLLAGYGIYYLLEYGKPKISGNIEAITNLETSGIYKYIRHPLYSSMILLGIETTTNLVTYGIYKYIRHPLYSSMILLGAVTLIKNPSLLATSLFSVATVFLYATARTEEKENLLKFGQDYAVYMKRSRMFFPFPS